MPDLVRENYAASQRKRSSEQGNMPDEHRRIALYFVASVLTDLQAYMQRSTARHQHLHPGAAPRIWPTKGPASITCSKLSSTSSICFCRR